jgi:hypothetical protein
MKINYSLKTLTTISLVMIAATACQKGDVKETLGISKSAPDEFMVLSRPSLAIPPDFNLVNPSEKKEMVLSDRVRNDIRATLTGAKEVTTKSVTKGEKALISHSNISADRNIRDILNEEYHTEKEQEESFTGSISKTIKSMQKKADSDILNPVAEQERLDELQRSPIN